MSTSTAEASAARFANVSASILSVRFPHMVSMRYLQFLCVEASNSKRTGQGGARACAESGVPSARQNQPPSRSSGVGFKRMWILGNLRLGQWALRGVLHLRGDAI